MDMDVDLVLATAANAAGNTFCSLIEKALSKYRERLFLFCINKDIGGTLCQAIYCLFIRTPTYTPIKLPTKLTR